MMLLSDYYDVVVGLGALWNRSNKSLKDLYKDRLRDNVRYVTLVDQTLVSWPENACTLCKKGILPNTEYGHGQEFLDHKMGLI